MAESAKNNATKLYAGDCMIQRGMELPIPFRDLLDRRCPHHRRLLNSKLAPESMVRP